MRSRWQQAGACRGVGPEKFYPPLDDDDDQDNQGREAKAICAGCPVRAACLDHAVRTNEQDGIWGGVGLDRRRGVRKVWLTGDTLAYQAALADEMDELARIVRGAADTRPLLPERACHRCGDRVPAGRYPPDRNGPAATCGVAATYNRGCRCRRCAVAKREHTRARRAAKRTQGAGRLKVIDSPKEHEHMSTTEPALRAVPEATEEDGDLLHALANRVEGTQVELAPELSAGLFADPYGWSAPADRDLSLPEAAGLFRIAADVDSRIRWVMGDLYNYARDLWPEQFSQMLEELDYARGTARNWGAVCEAFPREVRDQYDRAAVTDTHWLTAAYGETTFEQKLMMLDYLATHPMTTDEFKGWRDQQIDRWKGAIEVGEATLPEVTDPELTNGDGEPVEAKTLVISFRYHPNDQKKVAQIKKKMLATRDAAAEELGVTFLP